MSYSQKYGWVIVIVTYVFIYMTYIYIYREYIYIYLYRNNLHM